MLKSSFKIVEQNVDASRKGSVLLIGMSCTWAYEAYSSDWCELYLCLWSLLEFQDGACHREDDKATEVGQQSGSWGDRIQWVVAVQAGLSLACLLVGTAQEPNIYILFATNFVLLCFVLFLRKEFLCVDSPGWAETYSIDHTDHEII